MASGPQGLTNRFWFWVVGPTGPASFTEIAGESRSLPEFLQQREQEFPAVQRGVWLGAGEDGRRQQRPISSSVNPRPHACGRMLFEPIRKLSRVVGGELLAEQGPASPTRSRTQTAKVHPRPHCCVNVRSRILDLFGKR